MLSLQRESALLELSKRRETFADLAPILWHSFGTVSALLQEIVAIYPLLAPPSLTAQASNRVCNALALLQCVASHPETRTLFLNGKFEEAINTRKAALDQCDPFASGPDSSACSLNVRERFSWLYSSCLTHSDRIFRSSAAHIPLFLYPFLNTVSKTRPFEYLRLTSLGVIGALVKVRAIGT